MYKLTLPIIAFSYGNQVNFYWQRASPCFCESAVAGLAQCQGPCFLAIMSASRHCVSQQVKWRRGKIHEDASQATKYVLEYSVSFPSSKVYCNLY